MQAPENRKARASVGSHVTIDVYQLPGAVASDGTLDQLKICIVATPYGQNIAGFHVWGSLMARSKGHETFVGDYICIITNAPDIWTSGRTATCAVAGNNNAPDKMIVPHGSELYVATTFTAGVLKSTATQAVPVKFYGTPELRSHKR